MFEGDLTGCVVLTCIVDIGNDVIELLIILGIQ